MNKLGFVRFYVTQFLASYAASKYDENCLHGLKHTHPVTDAKFLAEQAWEELKKQHMLTQDMRGEWMLND